MLVRLPVVLPPLLHPVSGRVRGGIGSATFVAGVLKDLGASFDDLAAQVGLSAALLANPEYPISIGRLGGLFSVWTIGCAHIDARVQGQEYITDTILALANGILRTVCGPRWHPVRLRCGRHRPIDALRLGKSHASFNRLPDDAQYKKAQRLLLETEEPVENVARLLGYPSTRAFVLAFRRWSGLAPAKWRASEKRTMKPQPEAWALRERQRSTL